MKVEIVEKRDNEVVVKFTGQSPMDAMQMALVSLGPINDDAMLSTYSGGGWPAGAIGFGSFQVPVIADLQRKQEGK